jgi:hypothetical protein
MTTTNGLQLPRPNTGAYAVIEQLAARDLTYTDAVQIYRMARRNLSGIYPNIRHVGYTITRLLKKYGYKTGPSGTKAPWKFRPQTVASSGQTLPDIDQDERFSLPEDLEKAPEPALTAEELKEHFPLDCLVRYAGPLEQDKGIMGRVVALPGNPFYRTVMWSTTSEREDVYCDDIELYRATISAKTRGTDDVGGAHTRQILPGFEIGDVVEYIGSDYGTRGKRGTIVGIYGHRRQVNWGPAQGQSSENLSELKAVQSETLFEAPLPVGQFVSCKKNGLTFPAKVMLGAMSNGLYKVVCPNGTTEWVSREQMTPTEEKDVYQATPEKPKYEGEPEPSARTISLRAQLAESEENDRAKHFARLALRGLTDKQTEALYAVLRDEVFGDD